MKQVEQVLSDGSVVLDYDDPCVRGDVDKLFRRLFPAQVARDDKQLILFGNVGILTAAVTYLGHPWTLEKKRIQLKDYFPEYYQKNIRHGIDTLYVGIYHYGGLYLYVIFNPADYHGKKSHNSSAHVQTFDLQYAVRAGRYDKVDGMGNHITILDEAHFAKYIKDKSWLASRSTYEDVMQMLYDYFAHFLIQMPKKWNGIDCYKEMLAAHDNNAKQGEWQGFYFEYLFKKALRENPTDLVQWWSSKKDSDIDFDLVLPQKPWTYGDLKAESIDSDILGNSLESLEKVITEHGGRVLYFCCLCNSEKDSAHEYKVTKFWNQYRDNPYESEEEMADRYGKKMKYSVTPKEFRILNIDKTAFDILKEKPFNQGVNSNGKARKPKLKVTKGLIDALTVYIEQL